MPNPTNPTSKPQSSARPGSSNPAVSSPPKSNVTSTPRPSSASGPRSGWEKTCDCGFQVRDYNKGEFVGIVNTHLKTTHNMAPMSEAELIKGSKPITM
jgi:hypothetical protein